MQNSLKLYAPHFSFFRRRKELSGNFLLTYQNCKVVIVVEMTFFMPNSLKLYAPHVFFCRRRKELSENVFLIIRCRGSRSKQAADLIYSDFKIPVPDPHAHLSVFARIVGEVSANPPKESMWGPLVGQEKGHPPKLLGPDIFRWGGDLPREGVGAKKFGMPPRNPKKTHFLVGCPGFFLGRTPRGSYSQKGIFLPSRCLLESPFLEPLLRRGFSQDTF